MLSKSVVSLAFAASCLMAVPAAFAQTTDLAPPAAPAPMNRTSGGAPSQVVTNGPQSDHVSNWSAARNVRESRWYDHLVATNPGFRHFRERKECGPINDPRLHSQCLASFDRGAEAPRFGGRMYGSSRPPRPIRNSAGASQ